MGCYRACRGWPAACLRFDRAAVAASRRHWSAATAPAPLPAVAGCVAAISSRIENKNQDQNAVFFDVPGLSATDPHRAKEAAPGRDGTGRDGTGRDGPGPAAGSPPPGPGLRPRVPRRRGETPWPWPRPGPFSQKAAPGPDGRGACRRRPGSCRRENSFLPQATPGGSGPLRRAACGTAGDTIPPYAKKRRCQAGAGHVFYNIIQNFLSIYLY
ncbi:hypothetical protein DFW101_2579 [Solidesulfovibrio carbinoliphilus subsp. oakridgensis]|uniref:Uncharacterized protein n=1 Tax=Solidesulfovibrio carbinoliphilus subsp. oakridgensis TaxID=694327 RepID=G7Q8H1_9BACT|nr:hypothetical protein DFW101_2579 [Solidesulfovibrio carbinoliphilus subsp. oakridgensis]